MSGGFKKLNDLLGMSSEDLFKLAKKLDTPEMRRLYHEQRVKDEGFDQTVDELAKELDEIFEHKKDS